MNLPTYQVRRATVDDLEALRKLWHECLLPVAELEKQFKDFKVAVSETGELLGAIGLQILGTQGWMHSEAFYRPEWEDLIRPQMWDQLQIVAHNHALTRFWTLEQSPFWTHYAGFKAATAEELARLPVSFGDPKDRWLTLTLREEGPDAEQVDAQLKLLRLAQQEEMERIHRQAQHLRSCAMLIAVLLFIAVVMAGVFLIRRLPAGGIQ